MPVKTTITKEAITGSEDTKVHFIPASIDGNGAIKIDEYFNAYMENDANGLQVNSLRGYPLKGSNMKIPNNLQGVILRENEQLQIEGAERDLKLGGKFNQFTYWNYDKNPSENDCYRKALHWIKVAEVLHSEVESLKEDEQENIK